METNEVFEKVKGFFVEELDIDSSKITMDAWLGHDLEIDSLGIVEVIMAFEDEFGIEISDDEMASIQEERVPGDVDSLDTTVQKLCEFLSSKK